jgi:RNA 2',3'-cyclic 3'-phosphodiesterase
VSEPGGVRLFVAVDVPAPPREALAGWAREALGVAGPRLIAPHMLHITLSFLGATPDEDVAVVARLALGCARPVPDLGVGAPMWLPPRRPRVVAVSILDGEGQLNALQEDVSGALSAGLGLEPERRRFRPHVTVARMRAGTETARAMVLPTPSLRFSAEHLTVYRSRLSPSGATYEALERVALA